MSRPLLSGHLLIYEFGDQRFMFLTMYRNSKKLPFDLEPVCGQRFSPVTSINVS